MKKGFLVVLFMALIFPVFSQAIPLDLEGIWEGKDRFVFFENAADDENPELVIILKEYYGWYYDRAAEPLSYKDKEVRTPNAASHKDPEVIPFTINNLGDDHQGAYQMSIPYSKHSSDITTFAIIDDKIYLNPLTLIVEDPSNPSLRGAERRSNPQLYRGYQHSNGFLMYEQATDQNITLLIIDGSKYYDVRYWLTDMDYDPGYVNFTYKDDSYSVPKHLFADGTNYSCVSGRSKKVRNTMPSFNLTDSSIIYNNDKSVMIKDSQPYLTKLTDKKTIEDLMQIIKEANSRRKPDPQPIFPVKLPVFPGSDSDD